MEEAGRGGPLEAVDSKLTIYALANGVDLVREAATRRTLEWFRDGLERRAVLVFGGDAVTLTAAAWPTGQEADRREEIVAEGLSPAEAAERLATLLDSALERANAL